MYFLVVLIILYLTSVPTHKGKSMQWMKGISTHRGLFLKDQSIAENSITAFNASIKEQLDIELDVRITKDNQLIVFHDSTLSRMCGVDLTVEEETLETLQQYYLGRSQDKIPTLKDVIHCVDNKVNMLIEIKPTQRINELCTLITEQLDVYQGNFAICSFDPKIVRWFKHNRNHFIRGQIIHSFLHDKTKSLFNRFMLTVNGYNFYTRSDYVSVKYDVFSYYQWMRIFNGFVCVWSISNIDLFKKLRQKADHIIVEFINVKK